MKLIKECIKTKSDQLFNYVKKKKKKKLKVKSGISRLENKDGNLTESKNYTQNYLLK